MDKQLIGGLVSNKAEAEKIILSLVQAGVNPKEISLLSTQEEVYGGSFQNQAQEAARNWRNENRMPASPIGKGGETFSRARESKLEKHTHAAEGATAGATTGSVLGGTLGLLAGIGALAIPGIGPLVAAGPLMAALSGIGAGGTIGSILGALIGAGIPEKEAQHYEHRVREGSILLSACAQDENEANRIINILKQQGVKNISVSAEAASSNLIKK